MRVICPAKWTINAVVRRWNDAESRTGVEVPGHNTSLPLLIIPFQPYPPVLFLFYEKKIVTFFLFSLEKRESSYIRVYYCHVPAVISIDGVVPLFFFSVY